MTLHAFTNIGELVQPHLRLESDRPLEITHGATLITDGGLIVGAGPSVELDIPAQAKVTDLQGLAVVPGLVDSHTHVVYAGHRADELSRRSRGESYEEILAAGGGIRSSVDALAKTSVAEIAEHSAKRLSDMLKRGTTTVEIKTGYGLTPALELKHLEAIEATRELAVQSIHITALAHVVPKEPGLTAEAHLTDWLDTFLKPAALANRLDYVDVFVENGAFSADDARRIATQAQSLGLGLKLHVDQLSEGGGAALAAELGALSADHLEMTSDDGAKRLANSTTVATLLPGCRLFLGKGPWPPARMLRDAGCQIAVATDCNPGSSTVTDLPLCATIAATQCGLTLEESFWAVTRGGALALGLNDRGTLRPGERADFIVVDGTDWRQLLYQPGSPAVSSVFVGERQVWPPKPGVT